MSSYRNRRIRAQRKRHAQTVARLRDRIRTLVAQTRYKEAAVSKHFLTELEVVPVKQAEVKAAPYVPKHTYHHKIGTPLGLSPTSPVLEKQEPKVHGVNAQRETRSRPKVGGARRKNGP